MASNAKEVNVLSRAYDIGYDDGYHQGMIGAYDDYGNVVDLVEWEEKIRAEERAEILSELMGEVAMLNETKMTEGDLKGFAYRIKDIVVRGYAQNTQVRFGKEQNNG